MNGINGGAMGIGLGQAQEGGQILAAQLGQADVDYVIRRIQQHALPTETLSATWERIERHAKAHIAMEMEASSRG
jgi:hypothetical protein